jgi:flagellum-specific peptidoglycan hydrolase FlgJ
LGFFTLFLIYQNTSGLALYRVLFLSLVVSAFTHDGFVSERLYIQEHYMLAIKQMHDSGIPASVIMAQALLESDAGRSMLARRANNHFGIKCKAWWTGGKYYYADDERDPAGRLTPSCFRSYASVEASFVDHSMFLRYSERYASLFAIGSMDYREWAGGLQRCGYATSPDYAMQLIRIVERFHLDELDAPDK